MAVLTGRLRLIELLASLSLATDLATGQPMGHGIRTCLLAVRIARQLGCDSDEIRIVQQVGLLRFLGCTADAGEVARDVGGDEISFNATMAPVFYGGTTESLRALTGAVGVGLPPLRRIGLLAGVVADRQAARRSMTAHCEVAAMLAERLGLEPPVTEALGHAYERWDGGGFPDGLVGEDIPLPIRVCTVARDVDLVVRGGGDPVSLLHERRDHAYDPRVVDAFSALGGWTAEADWEAVLEDEPKPEQRATDLDLVLEVMADFADLKSSWTRGHSRRVARLASSAAERAGLGVEEVETIRRCGLIHDLGRVGVENGIWDKAGPLSVDEWEKVRLHPYLTERILSRCVTLRPLAETASRHHERLDGSGYHRQMAGLQLTLADQILAAADMWDALTIDRPHRVAVGVEDAADTLRRAAKDGRLNAEATSHVLAVAGARTVPVAGSRPTELTDREMEVLRLITKELTNRQMAEELFISPKTVGRHIENIYTKIGVSTRAGAAVYAMEHGLI